MKKRKKKPSLSTGYYIMAVMISITQSRCMRVKQTNRLITDGVAFLLWEKLTLTQMFHGDEEPQVILLFKQQ